MHPDSANATRSLRPRTVRLSRLAAALAVGGTIAALALAGPLDPPLGPVAPTYKTLTEVEPRTAISATNTPGDADSLFKITQRGSYYLTGNITGVIGRHGIEIAASGVTLDLNGFDLVGVPGMGAFDGVSATVASLTNITIRNGSVRNWGDEGVDLGTFAVVNSAVVDVRASGNAGNGITIGSGCSITACSTFLNTVNGIITIGFGCTISGCTAYFNTAAGISASIGCTISGCTARVNAVDGIVVASQCVVIGNNCSANGNGGDGAGIHVTGNDNRIEGNNCTGADRGIDVDVAGNIIIRNTCAGNTINWTIAANNVCGPILDRTAPASAAISGNSAVSSLGTTDANANFTY